MISVEEISTVQYPIQTVDAFISVSELLSQMDFSQIESHLYQHLGYALGRRWEYPPLVLFKLSSSLPQFFEAEYNSVPLYRFEFAHVSYQFKSNPVTNSPSISEKECFRRVVSALDSCLDIPIRRKLSQRKVIETVVGMASNQGSIYSTTNSLADVPCETSMRHHLQKLDFDFLQEKMSIY